MIGRKAVNRWVGTQEIGGAKTVTSGLFLSLPLWETDLLSAGRCFISWGCNCSAKLRGMLRPREVIVEHNYIHPFKSQLNFR